MRFLKFLVISVVTLGMIGYGVYYYGTNIASEKIMDTVSTELEKSGQMEEIKSAIENDPELRSFIEEGDTSKLPFTTKEEATMVLVEKVGVTQIAEMKSKFDEGTLTKEEALQEIQGKLTKEEIMALKVIAYKELNNR